jgi:hypothetical protein
MDTDNDDLDTMFDEPQEEPQEEIQTEAPTSEEPVEIPEESEPVGQEPKLVPIKALHDKARKVKELREELEKVKSQIPKNDQEPDMYEDPEGWKAYQRRMLEQESVQEQSRAFEERLEASELAMASEPNYEKVKTVFAGFANQDKSLAKQLFDHPDPARFAYEKGLEFINEIQGKKAEAVVTDKEIEAITSKVVTPSLAKATAAIPNTTQTEKLIELDDMFGKMSY